MGIYACMMVHHRSGSCRHIGAMQGHAGAEQPATHQAVRLCLFSTLLLWSAAAWHGAIPESLSSCIACDPVCRVGVMRHRVAWEQKRSRWPFMLPRYLWTISCGQRWLRQSGEHAAVLSGSPKTLLEHGSLSGRRRTGKLDICVVFVLCSSTPNGLWDLPGSSLSPRGNDKHSQCCPSCCIPGSGAEDLLPGILVGC